MNEKVIIPGYELRQMKSTGEKQTGVLQWTEFRRLAFASSRDIPNRR